MVHARSDHQRFQEPTELLTIISFLVERCSLAPSTIKEILNVVNKYSVGEFHPIANDEPVMLFRAKDLHFTDVLMNYKQMICEADGDPNIVYAIDKFIDEKVLPWRGANDHLIKAPDMPSQENV